MGRTGPGGLMTAMLLLVGLIGGCVVPVLPAPGSLPSPSPTRLGAGAGLPKLATVAPAGGVGASGAQEVPVGELTTHIAALWATVETGQPGGGAAPIAWSPRLTPALPTSWPPTAGGVWVRYVYAGGRELGGRLADAELIARPWARVELRSGQATARLSRLLGRLEPLERQGVRPLDEPTRALLAREAALTAVALSLTALPSPDATETNELRAFYRAWLNLNGVIGAVVRAEHSAFFAWVGG